MPNKKDIIAEEVSDNSVSWYIDIFLSKIGGKNIWLINSVTPNTNKDAPACWAVQENFILKYIAQIENEVNPATLCRTNE